MPPNLALNDHSYEEDFGETAKLSHQEWISCVRRDFRDCIDEDSFKLLECDRLKLDFKRFNHHLRTLLKTNYLRLTIGELAAVRYFLVQFCWVWRMFKLQKFDSFVCERKFKIVRKEFRKFVVGINSGRKFKKFRTFSVCHDSDSVVQFSRSNRRFHIGNDSGIVHCLGEPHSLNVECDSVFGYDPESNSWASIPIKKFKRLKMKSGRKSMKHDVCAVRNVSPNSQIAKQFKSILKTNECAVLSSSEVWEDRLFNEFGLIVQNVPGDGDCQYHSFAASLVASGVHERFVSVRELRSKIRSCLNDHLSRKTPFFCSLGSSEEHPGLVRQEYFEHLCRRKKK